MVNLCKCVIEDTAPRAVRILHLEDDPADAELIAAFLEANDIACTIRLVETHAEYTAALAKEEFDLVISDFGMPGYDGLHALRDLEAIRPYTPFILLSGQVGEETAVDCVKAGASDYVLKDRLERLPIAVYRALRDAEIARNQRETEAALKRSEARFRHIAEQSLAAIVVIEEEKIVYANKYCEELSGYPLKEIVHADAADVLKQILVEGSPGVIDHIHEELPPHEIGQNTFLAKMKAKSGELLWLQISINSFKMADREARVVVAVDVTKLKRSELERSMWSTAVRHAAEGFEITNAEGVIESVNPAMEHISGYSAEELIGQNARIFKSGAHDESFYREMWSKLKRGENWSGRLVNSRKEGARYHVETTISPIFDEGGKIINYIAVKRDTTQQDALEEQLRQVQKMEAIGTLVGGIAHDFNNILAAILGYAELALGQTTIGSATERDLSRVLEAGRRAKELIRQLLTFSRKAERVETVLDLRCVFKETARLLQAAIPSNVKVRLHYGEEPMTVLGDATQLHQLILNLCSNARDAVGDESGQIDLHLNHFNAGVDIQEIGLASGRYVLLTVTDNGCGMTKETVSRAFEPFFTTKNPEEGTGMGLAIVHGVVQAHRGVMSVHSEPGVGTEFKVYLPLVEQTETASAESVESVPMGWERILIVDDEPWLVEYFTRVLTDLGYTVIGTASSAEAWQTFQADPDTFDLLITDQTMPQMTGRQLIQQVKSIRADQPVIVLSGFSETFTAEAAYEIGVNAYLSKPVDRVELAETVRAVLDTVKQCAGMG